MPLPGMFNMPPSLSVDDLILQASIAASLFKDLSQDDGDSHPFAQVLSSFMDPAGVAAMHAATSGNSGSDSDKTSENPWASSENPCRRTMGRNPLADLLAGLGNLKPPSSSSSERNKSNCSGGGGCPSKGGEGCPMNKDEMRAQCQNKMNEHFKKMSEQGSEGHPLAQLFGMLDGAMNNGGATGGGGACGGGGSTDSSLPVHFGVECDKSGMNPIVGVRYTILGSNYDICSEEFEKLQETERMMYHMIITPGQSPVPVFEQTEKKQPTAPTAAEDDTDYDTAPVTEVKKPATLSAPVPTPVAAPVSAPVATPAVPEPVAAVEEDVKFESELLELAQMGFVDRDTNLALLNRYQGRVDRVVNYILEL